MRVMGEMKGGTGVIEVVGRGAGTWGGRECTCINVILRL